MIGKKIPTDFESDKEKTILDLVKKYPLYSVDKLARETPQISRHFIQITLEKHNLSTVEKRLQIHGESVSDQSPIVTKLHSPKLFGKLGAGKILLRIPRLAKSLIPGSQINKKTGISLVGLGLFLFFAFQLYAIITAKAPEIVLEKPSLDYRQKGKNLFIAGEVKLPASHVTVNDQPVFLNGDGSFTAIVEVPLGESTLEVKAVRRGKESKLLRLVTREPTDEEIQAQKEEEAKKKMAAADSAAELESKVTDLLAAKQAVTSSGQSSFIKIINNRLIENESFASIEGEVVNQGDKGVFWVMVTANFFSQEGNLIDTKYGFATDYEQVLKPGENADFQTQATSKKFAYYRLELSWEEDVNVAGASSPSAQINESLKVTSTPTPTIKQSH